MTESEVRNILRKSCDDAGGIRAWARKHKLSAAYVSDVLSARRRPGPAICGAFGLQAVMVPVTYLYQRVKK